MCVESSSRQHQNHKFLGSERAEKTAMRLSAVAVACMLAIGLCRSSASPAAGGGALAGGLNLEGGASSSESVLLTKGALPLSARGGGKWEGRVVNQRSLTVRRTLRVGSCFAAWYILK
jgi:hypothetical protein